MTDVLHTATAGSLYVEIVFVFDFKLIHFFNFGCIFSRRHLVINSTMHNGIRCKNASD